MILGSKILIRNAVEFFAALNNTCISDRTIALLPQNKDWNLYHHKAFGFFTLHFSFFTYTCIAYTTKNILWIHNNDRIHKIFVLNL